MKKPISAYLKWHDYRYYPYEKIFAFREVESLPGFINYTPTEDGIIVNFDTAIPDKLNRLVYFSKYSIGDGPLTKTFQALLENGYTKNNTKRQATRYLVHGLHEYKGKFNPQVVRCILNWYNLPDDSQIVDPFCGSGTSIIESGLAGFESIGWDLNPFAVYLTNAKILALKTDLDILKEQAKKIFSHVPNEKKILCEKSGRLEYLEKWFPKDTLEKIEQYRSIIENETDQNESFFKIILSDLLRDYSLQEPSDLRIRRRRSPFPNISIEKSFKILLHKQLDELERTIEITSGKNFKTVAFQADGRFVNEVSSRSPTKLRANFAITSPPYSAALPYIDTQRLSLIWLNLINPDEITTTEKTLIGSRDAAENILRDLEDQILINSSNLPDSIQLLCANLQERLSAGDGFRKRAVPGLLYRYFSDMKQTFHTVRSIMKPGGVYTLIVGTNRTTIGGQTENINTPELLSEVAVSSKWKNMELLPLETYKRYGMHAANAVQGETLLVLKK
ncbi:hypothetical protein [Methanoregula sp.]|uniref:hypothetical protein n=1 Tax=Methanoregula sp. TaxID=2052170 RepID=UPI00260F9A92|nr:hypothetical protein [Methanoregula sp.]MDD5143781.1 hypothetical protein [Methanoregula sp.]